MCLVTFFYYFIILIEIYQQCLFCFCPLYNYLAIFLVRRIRMTEGIVMSRGSCNGNEFFVKSPFLSCKVLISEYNSKLHVKSFSKGLIA